MTPERLDEIAAAGRMAWYGAGAYESVRNWAQTDKLYWLERTRDVLSGEFKAQGDWEIAFAAKVREMAAQPVELPAINGTARRAQAAREGAVQAAREGAQAMMDVIKAVCIVSCVIGIFVLCSRCQSRCEDRGGVMLDGRCVKASILVDP